MEKVECPKCSSQSAWYQITRTDKILRCMCGYHKVVETTLETVVIEHNDVGSDVKLPRRDTHLWKTLVTLKVSQGATSGSLTDTLNDSGNSFTVSDVASYLTILRSKGLVETSTNRRGVPGGSSWILTEACRQLLGA